jgi:KaiC/GvpD/RAD55 family RecA-like ATPase
MPARYTHGPIVENRDGSLAIGFRISAPYWPGTAEVNREDLFLKLTGAINALPTPYDGQVIYLSAHRTKDLEALGDDAIPQSARSDNPIIRRYNEEIFESLRARLEEGDLKTPRVYVTIVRRCGLNASAIRKRAVASIRGKGQGFLGKTWATLKANLMSPSEILLYTANEFDTLAEELMTIGEAFANTLQGAGLKVSLLKNQGIREVFYHFWQPDSYNKGGFTPPVADNDPRPILNTTVRTPFEWDASGKSIPKGMFRMDGVYHAILSIKSPPEEIGYPLWRRFVESRQWPNLDLVTNFRQGDLERRKKKLKDEIMKLDNAIRNSKGQKDDLVPLLEQLQSEQYDIGEGMEKTWDVGQFIRLWHSDPKVLKAQIAEMLLAAEESAGMLLTQEIIPMWEYFRVIQPFWAQDKDRYRELPHSTTQLVASLPLIGEADDREGGVGAVFPTFTGGLFNFYPFNRNLTNYNGIVIGGSGSGKSFLASNLVLQLARRKTLVILVDFGYSFRALTQYLGGLHIDLDPNSDVNRMNAMYCGPNALEPSELEQKVLFIQKLVCDDGKELMLQEQTTITEALQQLIRSKSGRFYLSDLRDTLRSYPEGKDLAARLSVWCNDTGLYGRLFDGESKISLNRPIITFEMGRLQEQPKLAAVMFATIVNYVREMGRNFPGMDKYLIFDEAAVLLKDPTIAKYIETAFRTMRKSGFSAIGLSQGMEEWRSIPNKDGIIKNLSNMIFLKQDSPQEVEGIAETFLLSEEAAQMLLSLQSVSGKYSQALMVQRTGSGNRCGFVNIIPTALGYAMATTNPKDREVLMRLFAEMDTPDALAEFARRYPQGVTNAA